MPLSYASVLIVLGLILGLPIALGLGQTVIGGLPALETAWHSKALALTAFTTLVATALSVLAALGLTACFPGRVRALTWASLPLLALPHAALAQALSLALAPSGVIVRALSPWATGLERPPSLWLWDQHPDGWTLILALAMKEVPFFLILMFTHSASLPRAAWQREGASLGYGPVSSWGHLVLPHLWPRLVLPLFVVLAFAASVVDVPAIVGPSRVKTFAHGLQAAWVNDTPRAEVFAGASWLVALTLLLLGSGALAIFALHRHRQQRQHWPRVSGLALGLRLGAGLGTAILALAYACLALLPLQSFMETGRRRSRFPDLWTGEWSFDAWEQALILAAPTLPLTLALGVVATGLSLAAALWLLEAEVRTPRGAPGVDLAVLIPLLVPQFAFLSGSAFLGLKAGLIPAQGFAVTVWFHALFVFPYVFLVLAPAYRGLDPAYARAGASLGHSPRALFWRLKLPLLLRPLSYAAAWGVAVSLALYLPTFFASGGRLETLLTVGVTQLAGKGDSVRAVWGLLLLVVPLCGFGLAALLAAAQAWRRRGLRA